MISEFLGLIFVVLMVWSRLCLWFSLWASMVFVAAIGEGCMSINEGVLSIVES